MKKTSTGKIDGRSISGGAVKARKLEKEESRFFTSLGLSAIIMGVPLWYLEWAIFDLAILEPTRTLNEWLSDKFIWVSLVVLIYIIFGISNYWSKSKNNLLYTHAFVTLVSGLFPIMVFGAIYLIGLIFRSIFS